MDDIKVKVSIKNIGELKALIQKAKSDICILENDINKINSFQAEAEIN